MTESESLPIVQFGAGAIGRGFLGQLWCEAGHKIVFVDAKPGVVGEMQVAGSYPIYLVGPKKPKMAWVHNFIAIGSADSGTAAWHIARCAFVSTAVGARALPALAPTLAAGIVARSMQRHADDRPLNILCCENEIGAAAVLREAVEELIPNTPEFCWYFQHRVAFVDAIVGRMVPPAMPSTTIMHVLAVDAEAYKELPIDARAWIGPVPEIPGLVPTADFDGQVARMAFTQNGGHAVLGYFGYRQGHEYVWQAAEDPAVASHLKRFWRETGAALARAYGFAPNGQRQFEGDLLRRFKNRPLADTVGRVARDVVRKLRWDDRLVGAATLCLANGVEPVEVCRTIAAAYAYDAPDDPSAPHVQSVIASQGLRAALERFSSLYEDSPLVPRIEAEFGALMASKR